MADLIIKNLNKNFGDNAIFNDFNLTVKQNKVVAILGASGVGKSTLLNIISGEITDYQGEILGAPSKISYVFSKDRLVPSLTVFENVKLVVKKDANADDKCNDILQKTGLIGAINLYPHQLSTGMAKRVNLARAFAYGGDLMLMDEPFANLDIVTKLELTDLFLALQKERKQTAIIVTHDVSEAVSIADEVVVIKKCAPCEVFLAKGIEPQLLMEKIKNTLKNANSIKK